MKSLQTKELISNIFAEAIGFLRISMVFSLKHFGEAHLMLVLIRNVHLVCIINGVRC